MPFFSLKKTIEITANIQSGYISYIRKDTSIEIGKSIAAVERWAKANNVNVKLDTAALSATCYE